MFTGIIEDVGTVRDIDDRGESMRLRIDSPIIDGADHGDSVSVNGVCLTVAGHDDTGFVADVMLETLNRTSLRGLTPGSRVNLERAARVGREHLRRDAGGDHAAVAQRAHSQPIRWRSRRHNPSGDPVAPSSRAPRPGAVQ